ncbi:MAG: DUF4338 domain-containing protein [Gammaproteobacteria bacterium]|nr:DUF4338 domain-containing protein [Gammaproteobacteria bacterium]
MIIPLEPKLEGLAERRFFSFARQMLDRQVDRDADRIIALVESETQRAGELGELRGQCDEYKACVRVLGDLAQLRWQLVDSGYGLELHSPRPQDQRVSDPALVRRLKEAIRSELRPRVLQQFANPNVRKFVRRVERPPASSGRRSIGRLIADGAELQDRLRAARAVGREDIGRAAALRAAVQPYLQLVDGDDRDEHTGLPLRDIWRYFRYTWSIPQTPIPGRNLHYLVRDAAHEHHAVIGIAGLSNCAVQLVPRDRTIGWSAAGLSTALAAFLEVGRIPRSEHRNQSLRLQGIHGWLNRLFPDIGTRSPAHRREALERVVAWLLEEVSTGIGEIERRGLATEQEIAEPTRETVARLRALSREFASYRQHALAGGGDPRQDAFAADIPVDDEYLDLEAKHTSNAPVHNSRRMLVGKKRAFELARLLDARRVLVENRSKLSDPATTLMAMEGEELRSAINTAMSTIKSRRIGTNMLEMTTCGAVAPYNRVLGGKLVALLMLSPEVAADNLRRYGTDATIIRSQLKNAPVVPDNTLVWMGTTSLFAHGSSQYERLRLPAGVIADDQPEIRYSYLGDTTGYGTVQFADDTVRALEVVLRHRRGFRDVNGVFGEGASPRLRKLRSGLDAVGFQAEVSMLHHQERRIYGVPLFPTAAEYLCGLRTSVPSYIAVPGHYSSATERIAEFWRTRWLSSRLAHDESWEALGGIRRWALSSSVPLREPPPGGGGGSGGRGRRRDDGRLAFWRRLARAGSNAVSEGLTETEFEALHLPTPLEDYLLARARDGVSIVLTGNAGDGKTHLARALERRLKEKSSGFEFGYDATAMMNAADGVAPIVERWRNAERAGKRMILAINQYPLYMLRRALPEGLPAVAEGLDRQWRARLTAGADDAPSAEDSVLLVDLSLRNALAPAFAARVLEKMLDDEAVKQHAASGGDPDFSFNYERLAHPQVQERLFELFGRLISAGHRTTVRELWIMTARLLFGASSDGDLPGVPAAWYSERLFAKDVRFPLTDALVEVADPAGVSHPHVDRYLERPRNAGAGKWNVGDETPDALPTSALAAATDARDRDRGRFLALKRRFYFEHASGGERVFELDGGADARFHRMLQTPEEDAEHLGVLVEAVNRCYFPHRFEGMRDRLCLWIGHRLDEQPTKSFVAGECIPQERLSIVRPVPPPGLRETIEYEPDHLLLRASGSSGTGVSTALRVDAVLFRTLSAVREGLPRHLINPGELNRLDAFVDRLGRMEPSRLGEFLAYNAEQVVSSTVKVSLGEDRYLDVERLNAEHRP